VADLKSLRKRIGSVKSTQKITRAMKMVAGARLAKAQQRILALRPYAVQTSAILSEVVTSVSSGEGMTEPSGVDAEHPLLARRPEKNVLYLVVTSDRGLCGSFNSTLNKAAERGWKEVAAEGDREDETGPAGKAIGRATESGRTVRFAVIGRKGRDYLRRRNAPIFHVFEGVWEKLGPEQARNIARVILKPFVAGEVDAVYLVYNEFKSAMSQKVVFEPLFPLSSAVRGAEHGGGDLAGFTFEPNKSRILEHLVPMYVETTILRALYESTASELGARMTAMDSATKNASELMDKLTLKYNRARQAAITTEIMEIIGGAEALKG